MLDLQGAVRKNIKTFVSYYKETWPDTKYDLLLLGDDPLETVPMELSQTFTVMSKYHTTYKKHGLCTSWIDQNECHDMKHPHHIFLLQNICDKVTFRKVEQVRKMNFPLWGEMMPIRGEIFTHHHRQRTTRPLELSCVGLWEYTRRG